MRIGYVEVPRRIGLVLEYAGKRSTGEEVEHLRIVFDMAESIVRHHDDAINNFILKLENSPGGLAGWALGQWTDGRVEFVHQDGRRLHVLDAEFVVTANGKQIWPKP